jgi:hypothetical protein
MGSSNGAAGYPTSVDVLQETGRQIGPNPVVDVGVEMAARWGVAGASVDGQPVQPVREGCGPRAFQCPPARANRATHHGLERFEDQLRSHLDFSSSSQEPPVVLEMKSAQVQIRMI